MSNAEAAASLVSVLQRRLSLYGEQSGGDNTLCLSRVGKMYLLQPYLFSYNRLISLVFDFFSLGFPL
jgi:cephalosporin-C deacetylase-like acetyl esterase